MKTVSPPLPGRSYTGRPYRPGRRARIDRWHRQLVDRLPRLQPSAHKTGGRRPARTNAACDVRRPCARAGASTCESATDIAARRSHARVLFRLRLSRSRSRHEDGSTVLDQPRCARQEPVRGIQKRLSWRHHRCHGGERSGGGHALSLRRPAAQTSHRRTCRKTTAPQPRSKNCWKSAETRWQGSSSSRWCRVPVE